MLRSSSISARGKDCAYKYLEVPKIWQLPIQINLPIYNGLGVFDNIKPAIPKRNAVTLRTRANSY